MLIRAETWQPPWAIRRHHRHHRHSHLQVGLLVEGKFRPPILLSAIHHPIRLLPSIQRSKRCLEPHLHRQTKKSNGKICHPGCPTREARLRQAARRCTRQIHLALQWRRERRIWAASQACKVRLRWLHRAILPPGNHTLKQVVMHRLPRLLKLLHSRLRRVRIRDINIPTSLCIQIIHCSISIISPLILNNHYISNITCHSAHLPATCMKGTRGRSISTRTTITNTPRIICQPLQPKRLEPGFQSRPS